MKKILYSLMVILWFVSCVPSVEEPEPDVDKLLGTWSLGTTGYVSRDGVDITNEFPGLSIAFKDGKMDVVNGGQLFPFSQDIWTYTKLDKTRILRVSDNLEMDVEIIEDTLFLRFTYQYVIVIPTGRISTVSGKYEIKLPKSA